MQKHIRYFIIPLLVAAIGSFSIANAGADFCPPDCSHCGIEDVVSPCCDDMNTDREVTAAPDRDSHGNGYRHGSYCDAIERGGKVLSVNPGVDIDYASAVHTAVFSLPDLPARQYTHFLKSPPHWRIPSLYTLHCALLI